VKSAAILLLIAATGCAAQSPTALPELPARVLLFEERFEDPDWEARGWYDSPRLQLTDQEHLPGSTRACAWHWARAGAINTEGGGARLRLPPVESVTLEFSIKHSADWQWTGVDWHPHEFHFITSEDDPYVGPARTHLTFYVEVVNGRPRLAIQDGANIDEKQVGQNLVGRTEARAVAGCNGDADGHGEGNCYQSGAVHANGKYWQTGEVYFGRTPGPRYQGDWHQVRARFKLNTVVDGVGMRDGELQYWFDDKKLLDERQVVFRTGQHPQMKIDQFLMAPYYGPGVPHEQWIWIDELRIYTDAPP
jgi:hypothetical protein